MLKKLRMALLISGIIYFLFIILSFIFYSNVHIDFLAKAGVGLGFFIIVALLPLNKMLFFSTRAGHPGSIPDEHLYQEKSMKQAFDGEDAKNKKQQYYIIVSLYSGVLIVIVAMGIIILNS